MAQQQTETKRTPEQQRVLDALRRNADTYTQTDANGDKWQSVYLDNARPDGMSGRAFAGHLSALERAGLYRPDGDDCFGLVKMAAPACGESA